MSVLRSNRSRRAWRTSIIGALVCVGATSVRAQSGAPADTTPKLDIYGFGQADMITDFKRNDPNWFDVNRTTKLPSNAFQFGKDGHTWLSARQSRFGVKGVVPTRRGDVTAVFDFDMF